MLLLLLTVLTTSFTAEFSGVLSEWALVSSSTLSLTLSSPSHRSKSDGVTFKIEVIFLIYSCEPQLGPHLSVTMNYKVLLSLECNRNTFQIYSRNRYLMFSELFWVTQFKIRNPHFTMNLYQMLFHWLVWNLLIISWSDKYLLTRDNELQLSHSHFSNQTQWELLVFNNTKTINNYFKTIRLLHLQHRN